MVEGVSSVILLILQGAIPSSHLVDSNPSNRDMSPLTDVDTESYPSEEDTDDELRTFSSEEGDENEYMIKVCGPKLSSFWRDLFPCRRKNQIKRIIQQKRYRSSDVTVDLMFKFLKTIV
ncbi:uncharacterized protein EV420DRAFT_1161261 [Desarmillaria tabescens]|uniref:Uncharacterized protein n=1 Tax=Armillaria tabescens TaxID=1929756 RepID=A0AA39NCW7_ARMTA|nr:uncharacterized protein EV420DRAFT_1161261 [Desarmillaria tabescens]KAK0463219.1 hypothetical protein EV420DRAFT_1161261 [Desarmillaria tabescens]